MYVIVNRAINIHIVFKFSVCIMQTTITRLDDDVCLLPILNVHTNLWSSWYIHTCIYAKIKPMTTVVIILVYSIVSSDPN